MPFRKVFLRLLAMTWTSNLLPEYVVAKELSAFERALMSESIVTTKETIVQYGDRKYRRVEYENETFYLQLQTEVTSQADLQMLCSEKQAAAFNADSKPHITAAVRITKRTRLFVQGLQVACSGSGNQAKLDVMSNIAVGFMLDDSPDPKAVLKNRRIYIAPGLSGAGFSAEF